MRKMLLALAIMFGMAGLVIAVEVTAVSYDKDKKELTVKEGDKEVKYPISDKVKITKTVKGEDTDVKFEDFEKEKLAKIGKGKLDITTEDGKITAIKYKGKK